MFWELYGSQIIDTLFGVLATILTAIAGYVGLKLKAYFETKEIDYTKKKIVETVVRAVEQMYKDLHGEDKLNKAIEGASEMLNEKGIVISELELRMLIEDTIGAFNNAFNKSNATDEVLDNK